MTDVVVEEQPLTTVDKFELLIKDFTTLMDTTKSLSARMKVLQKEVNKGVRGKRRVVKEVDPNAPKKVSALQKPVVITNELCKFLGFEPNTEHSRQEVTASINAYIKANDLQDPKNRRFILLEGSDAALSLKKLLRDPDQPVTFFNIQRYLKPHYPPKEEVKTEPVEVVPDAAPVVEETPVPAKPPAKKRVVRNPKSA